MTRDPRPAFAYVDGRLATGLVEVTHDVAALDEPGFWVVVGSFEGEFSCARFADVRAAPLPALPALPRLQAAAKAQRPQTPH